MDEVYAVLIFFGVFILFFILFFSFCPSYVVDYCICLRGKGEFV